MIDGSDVANAPCNVTTTIFSIQQHVRNEFTKLQQPQKQGKWNQQGGARRNVYRTNSRRRYDLTPAVRRCAVTDKTGGGDSLGAPAAAVVADDAADAAQHQQSQQPQPTLFSRRYVINLDPLTPRPAVDPVRPGRGNVMAGKATRWQRQQTTYQLTPRTEVFDLGGVDGVRLELN